MKNIVVFVIVVALFSCKKNDTPLPCKLIIDGNSIGMGAMSTNGGYGPYLHKLFPDFRYFNIAISGQLTSQMIQRKYIDTVLSGIEINLLIVEEASNDLHYGATGDSTYKNLKTYCTQRKEKFPNTKIILISPTTRQSRLGFENDRQKLLALLTADFPLSTPFPNIYLADNRYADVLVDVGNDKNVGVLGMEKNIVYYQNDFTHPTDSGYIYRGQMIANGIREAIK